MLIKGVILSAFVYQKQEPKPYIIYENGHKKEGYSYSLVADLLQQDSACPTIKCSEEVYHSVNEYRRYAFICTVDTEAGNSSNRFKIVGFASDEILEKNDWFSVTNLPIEQCVLRTALLGANPFADVKAENMQKFQKWVEEQAKTTPAPVQAALQTATQTAPVQAPAAGATEQTEPLQGEPSTHAETDKQSSKTKK